MINHNRIYIAPSHTKKVFANMKRQGKDFSGRVTPLFLTMMVQAQQEQGEGSDMPTITQPSSSQPLKKHKPRKPKKKDTQIPQFNVPSDNLADEAVNEKNVSKHSNDPLLSGEDRLKLKELMALFQLLFTIMYLNYLAQTLAELKSARPKTKGVVIQEPSETITTTTTIPSKDKGKEAIRIQAQFDEEERITREKEEANAALIAQWNDIQD
ncbi:hypothetical protein Tco_0207049 [Tanacetum coccineum]